MGAVEVGVGAGEVGLPDREGVAGVALGRYGGIGRQPDRDGDDRDPAARARGRVAAGRAGPARRPTPAARTPARSPPDTPRTSRSRSARASRRRRSTPPPRAAAAAAQPAGAQDARDRAREREHRAAPGRAAQLGERLELDAVGVAHVLGADVALLEVAVLITAAAVAEDRVGAGVLERDPPEVDPLGAGVEAEAAGLGAQVRRPLVLELVDLLPDPVDGVPGRDDESDDARSRRPRSARGRRSGLQRSTRSRGGLRARPRYGLRPRRRSSPATAPPRAARAASGSSVRALSMLDVVRGGVDVGERRQDDQARESSRAPARRARGCAAGVKTR